ncbi:hypothetical protein LF296_12675 [Acinetobacter vivianii]|uniref:Uncharacterized protein n=1 Tax=Acinetobacter vivianii TaxID=1776742 RepID=A0AAJ6NGW3_9GAMM|nr:hypothetical protein [Acinetobacter vivianii]WDZ50174.1 hypothetical protein LF296_12675 [Acinetobacter vivianii]
MTLIQPFDKLSPNMGVFVKKILILSLVAFLLGCDKNENTKAVVEENSKPKVENEYNKPLNSSYEGDKSIKLPPISEPVTGSWHIVSLFNEEQEKLIRWAVLRSENNAKLDFQDNGENRLQLDILDSSTVKPKIFLTIDKGQYDCEGNLCSISVKFENNPIQHFTFSKHEPQVNGGIVLILSENAQEFLENVRKYNNLTLEVPFHDNGVHQFEFNISKFTNVEEKIRTS